MEEKVNGNVASWTYRQEKHQANGKKRVFGEFLLCSDNTNTPKVPVVARYPKANVQDVVSVCDF